MSDHEPDQDKVDRDKGDTRWVAMGLALGVGIGAALGDVAAGIAIGLAIGAGIMASGKKFPGGKE